MAEQPQFSPKLAATLTAIGLSAFLAMILILNLSQFRTPMQKAGTTTLSNSAIGHKAFLQYLKRLGYTVLISQNRSAEKASGEGMLMLLEPWHRVLNRKDRLGLGGRTVLVLPKWSGKPEGLNRSRIQDAALVPSYAVRGVAAEILLPMGVEKIDVQRLSGTWNVRSAFLEPFTFDTRHTQVLTAPGLTPIATIDGKILAGSVRSGSREVLVISDPDLLSNHGIHRGDHAFAVASLLEKFARGEFPTGKARDLTSIASGLPAIVIDETIHGMFQRPNLVRSALDPPFVITTILGVAAVAFLVWAAIGRFGAPVNDEETAGTGKIDLLDNTAELFLFADQVHGIFASYQQSVRQDVARRLNAPRTLGHAELTDWLARVGNSLGASADYRELFQAAEGVRSAVKLDRAKALSVARRLGAWRKEVLSGS